MNAVLVNLGFIKIYWYSFLIFIALLIGGTLALKEAKRFYISEDTLINMFFYLIPISVIGARLYYVVFNWSYYKNNMLEIIEIWNGGLAIHGAILFGIIYLLFATTKNNIKFFRMTDILAVSLLIGQAIGRWGNFFNQEAHGPETTLEFLQSIIPFDFIINGMNIGGTYYHPTFLYESLWCLIGFVILLFVRRLKYIKIGQITGTYFIWYGIGRFIIESLRTDSLMLGNIKIAQLVSVGLVIIGIIIIIIKGKGFKLDSQYNQVDVKE